MRGNSLDLFEALADIGIPDRPGVAAALHRWTAEERDAVIQYSREMMRCESAVLDRPAILDTVAMKCSQCGCTDDRACPGGCSWTAPGLCSRCSAHMTVEEVLSFSTRSLKQQEQGVI